VKLRKLSNALLIVDARLRGLSGGLLDSHCHESIDTIDGCDAWLSPVNESVGPGKRLRPVIKFHVRLSESMRTDSGPDWQERYRFALERDEEGAELRWLVVEKSGGDSATESDRSASRNLQLLVVHHSRTEVKMRELARRLGLSRVLTEVLALAARLHDEGKRALRWQRAFKAPPDGPYAKTKGPINFAMLGAYRHEFGSLQYAAADRALMELPEDLRDLALHLIASHHAQARPVIGAQDCDDAPPSVLEERARQVALRFVRLQERWGPWGLAWLETLLRSADQQASRENDVRLAGAV
jgi:CRISPR-associated endonuclease/helicase Cas3